MSLPNFCGMLLLIWAGGSPPGREEGRWIAPAHMSDRPAARVVIRVENGRLSGRIDSLLVRRDNPVCSRCQGERKDKPILGMEILWGFENREGRWEGGNILDPESGRVFRCDLSLSADSRNLLLRGYWKWTWLGRSTSWKRAD